MPLPGQQHGYIANPFEEPKKRMTEYTAQEIATLQSRLEKQLGPEYLSSRSGPSGQKVHYIAAEKCIALANEVFGFNGWSSSIQNIQVDFADENPQTMKVNLGLSVIVRVTLRDGTFHEDIGYGHIENCKSKAAAFEKAKKEGTTDALKRALRNFGNVLGNCIYDKDYLNKVTKIKVAPKKFDADKLHRHEDFAVKKEPAVEAEKPRIEAGPASNVATPQLLAADSFEDFLGELDEADFNIIDEGHPDEVVLPVSHPVASNDKPPNQTSNSNASMQPPARALVRTGSAGANPPRPPQTPNQQPPPRQFSNSFNGPQGNTSNSNSRPPPNQQFNQSKPPPAPQNQSVAAQPPTAAPQPPVPTTAPPEGVGFFSARAVKNIAEDAIASGHIAPKGGQVFNPKAESPSIRKTPGIDHTKSKPVARNGQHVPPATSGDNTTTISADIAGSPGIRPMPRPGPPMGRGNVINPQLDQTRRIGAPGSSSPLANRNQYRPPTMKRPPGADVAQPSTGRPPLADLPSNAPATTGIDGPSGPDTKRQRIS
ncbi:hypothetical protein QBC34DRAFT_344090 [Podospora aff. communis PSN243]|uniref:RAD52 homolog n=1 Tax=Podospora aff. communis PSN243 TaxID=3040156 RepID=A0AAV9H4G0_9PEZI|nr:hypothetical protein QBC34DRAFT_344090 [Podospora aff. communis PSN243]